MAERDKISVLGSFFFGGGEGGGTFMISRNKKKIMLKKNLFFSKTDPSLFTVKKNDGPHKIF